MKPITIKIRDEKDGNILRAVEASTLIDREGAETDEEYVERAIWAWLRLNDRKARATDAAHVVVEDPGLTSP